jgi:hypothetical protein
MQSSRNLLTMFRRDLQPRSSRILVQISLGMWHLGGW